jgi:hypothetical protein
MFNFDLHRRSTGDMHIRRRPGYEWCVRHRGENTRYAIQEMREYPLHAAKGCKK